MALVRLTDIDDGLDIGIYEMDEALVAKLDEVLSGHEMAWERVTATRVDEQQLRDIFGLRVCDHAPQDYLRGGCVCGWKRGTP